jgi:quinone-modifying oxidoreductase subunit QmoC
MADVQLLKPDRSFVADIVASGGGDLKKCFQCATCSVVCELSTGRSPFPRKEMLWAQWGLKDRLMADPDVWLCHQCNDCSTRCPRGARPGDVLAAVRQQAVRHYAVPRFLATWANGIRFLPIMLLIPAVLVAATLFVRGPLERILPFGAERGFYAEFFPHWLLIGFYGLFTGLALVVSVVGVARFWRAMKAADLARGAYAPAVGVLAALGRTLRAIGTHERFGKCTAQAPRRLAHLSAFYGFLALYVVTVWAVFDLYVNPHLGIASMYPFGLLHPMKMLANVGGVALAFGCVKAIVDRTGTRVGVAGSTAFDWLFVWLLLGVALTGFVTEALRFAVGSATVSGLADAAYAVYLVHLVLVFQLLVYLPYSKFAHLLYRTTAMVYAEHSGRSRPVSLLGAADVAALPADAAGAAAASAEARELVEVGGR